MGHSLEEDAMRVSRRAVLATVATVLPTTQGRAATKTLSEVLETQLKIAETRIVGAAEAMPEANYGFVPGPGEFQGVRTFGEQVKHAAAANYTIFAGSGASHRPPT